MPTTKPTDFAILARLLREARPYWPHLVGLLLLNLLATPLSLLSPLPIKLTVDSVLGSQPIPAFLTPMLPQGMHHSASALMVFSAVLLIGVAVLIQVRRLVEYMYSTWVSGKVSLEFRSRLFWHGQRLSLGFHDSKGVSHALYRVQYDAAAIRWVAIDGLIPLVSAFIALVSMMVVIALISLKLVAVALIIVPVLILLIRGFRLPLRRGWSKQKDLSNAAMSVINEVFSSLRVVKAFTQEEPERDRFTRHATQSFLAQIRVTFLQGSFDLMTGVVIATGTGIVLYVGVGQIQQGLMTTGDLLVVMAYLGLLYGPLQVIGSQVAGMQDSLASAERAFEFLDEQTEVEEKLDALPVQRVNGNFRIKDLYFSYTPESPVLQNVSIDIPAGARVGIAGKTGAGKSTFLSLLMRFYDPTSGSIELDGVNLKDYRVSGLRQQFGIVLQEPVLFSTSIADNIAYGRPSSSDEEIMAAARAANAHDFIQEFEHGYQTLVGERGMRLSGGERQRIALARAFLRDAPILLLDEPTSSVDLKTEALIMDAMELLMQGRTVFLIAHRLSTLKNCDMIFEVKDRHIEQVERGSFDSFVRVQSGTEADQLTR